MKYWTLLLLFFSIPVCARNIHKPPKPHKPIKVAVIDTGLSINDPRFEGHICAIGSKDFTGLGLDDTIGHGTHVSGLIEKYAGKGNYCLLIYKYYGLSIPDRMIVTYEADAIEEAINNGATIVNFSGGGGTFSETEYLLIKDNPKVLFVVAAGNEGKNIDKKDGRYYPASLSSALKNIIVVGNLDKDGTRDSTSNFASHPISWEVGEDVVSTLPNGETGELSGTSMSCAIHTGKIIRKLLNAN